MGDISIGIPFVGGYYHGTLCSSVGDSLGMSPIIEKLNELHQQKIVVCTAVPELFLNNPFVKEISSDLNPTIRLEPCRFVACNIIQHYASQTGVEVPREIRPKIYLSPEEIEYGKKIVEEFGGSKIITVSTETGYDSKNLRDNYIAPFFDRLREEGYKLIGLGLNVRKYYDKYNKSFINATTLRQAISIINASDLFLGIDNGLFHIAAALDVPQVIFFRNNLSSNNAYPNTFFIDSKIKCQGDCLNHRPKCHAIARCMDNFDLDGYFELITEQLNK